MIGRAIGPYQVVAKLGEGGMGEVYRAHDPRLGRDVALKVLPEAFATQPDRLARFRREAQALAALNHPHIAHIYGVEEAGGTTALVMEFAHGATLAERLADGPLPLEDALQIARQIADALEAAHEHGIVHRDLKPANVSVADDGTVKVLDFGLAKAIAGEPIRATNGVASASPTVTAGTTGAGMVLGTAAYMAPEQARGKPVDKRADIWAFGCVLYEMLTGQRAFQASDVTMTLAEVVKNDPDARALPPDVPHSVRVLLRRCFQKDPRQRMRDIGDVRLVLEGVFDRADGQAADAHHADSQRLRILLAVAAGMVVILGGLLIWMWGRDASPAAVPVVRVAVDLPSGEPVAGSSGIIAGTWQPLAVSPDGTRLAYVSQGRLYLREMNSLDARPAIGTEGAWSPFFSPDGRWVGFFAQGQLKKVAVAGGAAQPLAEAPVAAGGAWGPDDTIYFAPFNASGLWKVSAAGGTAEAVTTLDREQGEVSHRWPQLLPGGEELVFTVWKGPGWDEMELQVQRLATGGRRLLIHGASTGRYVTSGHLLYTRAGEMFAVAYDAARGTTGGQPAPLGIQVVEGEGAHYAVSDTGVLAYVPGTGQFERQLASVGQDGEVEPLAAPVRAYEDAVLSPDGTRLALTVSGQTWAIWVHDLIRGTQSLVTAGLGSSQWPLWTPDGDSLIYRGTRLGSRNLYRKAVDGSGLEERLTSSEALQTPSSISPDGRWLVFTEVDPRTRSDLWVMSLEQPGESHVLVNTPASEDQARFSPDGSWLAYVSDESGRAEIYVGPFAEPGAMPGGRVLVSTEGTSSAPIWARDGRALYYVSGDSMVRANVTTDPVFRVTGTATLFSGASRLRTYAPGPEPNSSQLAGAASLSFLGIGLAAPQPAGSEIHLVVNWFSVLDEVLPAR